MHGIQSSPIALDEYSMVAEKFLQSGQQLGQLFFLMDAF